MINLDIARQRLHNQLITEQRFAQPADVVKWLGAVQSQDYGAAKWALGLRLQGVSEDEIEQAFDDGFMLRTHVMRPTWHFVLPDDISWMLALTAPRVKAALAYYDRKLELDDVVFARCNEALVKALQGGKQLTRTELVPVFKRIGIATGDAQRVGHLIMHAELDAVICSGARRGKQFTYALLEERAPQARTLSRDEALAELTARYFTSHGPAILQDFVWWSGLTMADAKAGVAMLSSQLMQETIDGQTYWFAQSTPPATDHSRTVHLLPTYDEYTVAYTDRSAVFDEAYTHRLDPRGGLLTYIIVLDGQVIGTWKRTIAKDTVVIEPNLFIPLDKAEKCALVAAAERYGAFLKRSVSVSLS